MAAYILSGRAVAYGRVGLTSLLWRSIARTKGAMVFEVGVLEGPGASMRATRLAYGYDNA